MKLQELLDVICDDVEIYVWGDDGEPRAAYDGRNSIPEELNDEEVLLITASPKGHLEVVI